MGAEYLPYVKSIANFAPTFYGYIISVLASVRKAVLDLGYTQGILGVILWGILEVYSVYTQGILGVYSRQ